MTQKFWSQGSHLGYLGPGSQKGLHEMFSKPYFLLILDPKNSQTLVLPLVLEKSLKTIRTWCGYKLKIVKNLFHSKKQYFYTHTHLKNYIELGEEGNIPVRGDPTRNPFQLIKRPKTFHEALYRKYLGNN